MRMGHKWKSGQYNAICDVCGWRFKSGDLRDRWDGMKTCKWDWEERHPMDYYNPKGETSFPLWTRPEVQPAVQTVYYENDFSTTTDSWFGQNGVFTLGSGVGILTDSDTGSALHLVRSFPDGFSGSDFSQVTIRFKDITANPNGQLQVFYSTTQHGYTLAYYDATPFVFEDNSFRTFDMAFLTAGSNDWINSQITGVRFSFSKPRTLGDTYEVDYIGITR